MADTMIRLMVEHAVTPEQQRWLDKRGAPRLVQNANARMIDAIESILRKKAEIEHDTRLTSKAKIEDTKAYAVDKLATLTNKIGDLIKENIDKPRAVVLREAAQQLGEPKDDTQRLLVQQHLSTVDAAATAFDSDELLLSEARNKFEDGMLSKHEVALLYAAEDGDVVVVSAAMHATPTWRRAHGVRAEVVDRARQEVLRHADAPMAEALDAMAGIERGLRSGLASTKSVIAERLGMNARAFDEDRLAA